MLKLRIRSIRLVISVTRIPYFAFWTTTSPLAISVSFTRISTGSPSNLISLTADPAVRFSSSWTLILARPNSTLISRGISSNRSRSKSSGIFEFRVSTGTSVSAVTGGCSGSGALATSGVTEIWGCSSSAVWAASAFADSPVCSGLVGSYADVAGFPPPSCVGAGVSS